jgi:hypothetical protein
MRPAVCAAGTPTRALPSATRKHSLVERRKLRCGRREISDRERARAEGCASPLRCGGPRIGRMRSAVEQEQFLAVTCMMYCHPRRPDVAFQGTSMG